MPEAKSVGIKYRAAGRSPRLSILLPRPTRPRIRGAVLNLINYPLTVYMSTSTITLLEWADRMIHLFENGSLPRPQWFNRANNVFVRLPKSELYSDRTDNVPCSLLAV